MKTNITKKGFTLIELLVVITIIGILATGGISVYTSQIQKARDSNRITDIKVLQGAIEQAYQDNASYPLEAEFLNGNGTITGIRSYLEDIPADSKTGQACNRTSGGNILCGYSYAVDDTVTGITNGAFELSTAFENTSNVTQKAVNTSDGGNSPDTFEIGIDKDSIDSAYIVATATTTYIPKKGACKEDMSASAANGDIVIIYGSGSCV